MWINVNFVSRDDLDPDFKLVRDAGGPSQSSELVMATVDSEPSTTTPLSVLIHLIWFRQCSWTSIDGSVYHNLANDWTNSQWWRIHLPTKSPSVSTATLQLRSFYACRSAAVPSSPPHFPKNVCSSNIVVGRRAEHHARSRKARYIFASIACRGRSHVQGYAHD